jgi:hypothetical protein
VHFAASLEVLLGVRWTIVGSVEAVSRHRLRGSAAILLLRALIVDYREARTVNVTAALIIVSLLFWDKGRQQ